MNVFVLCTGRCGSTTFARACQHITNFTSAHESNWGRVGHARFDYPPNHIEADNRLTWMLGTLDDRFGTNAFYVHLQRDRTSTAKSFDRRWGSPRSIIEAYGKAILSTQRQDLDVCLSYVDCVNDNIRLFLKDKPHHMTMTLETLGSSFAEFWDLIGAVGELDAAMATLAERHNASDASPPHAASTGLRRLRRLRHLIEGGS
jgi:hypothetical protein